MDGLGRKGNERLIEQNVDTCFMPCRGEGSSEWSLAFRELSLPGVRGWMQAFKTFVAAALAYACYIGVPSVGSSTMPKYCT